MIKAVEKCIEVTLSGVSMRVGLRFAENAELFRGFIVNDDCDTYDVCVTEEDLSLYPLVCPSGVLDRYSEFYMLMARASSFLLPKGCAVFHGVSFLWRGRAWMITAHSGVGKTTQLRHWQRLYGDQIEIVNGDKMILRLEDGRVFVDPSPWTGKEGDMGFTGGELAGIICLEQAAENSIARIAPRDSVMRLFSQFLFLAENEQEIRSAARIEEAMLSRCPVWLLKNLGDEASAILTYEALCANEEAEYESDQTS